MCWSVEWAQISFSIRSRFARDILSVLMSTLSSKSAFSSTELILDERRLSFKSNMVEIWIVVKDLKLVDRRAQETTRNSKEIIDYFENFCRDDAPQSSRPLKFIKNHNFILTKMSFFFFFHFKGLFLYWISNLKF